MNIYIVRGTNGTAQRLVRAASKASALRHVAESTLTAAVASGDDIHRLATQQVIIEEAGRDLAAEADAAALRG